MLQALGNVGDCRAAYRRVDGDFTVLTEDHRGKTLSEARRVRKCGGYLREGRVFGVLEQRGPLATWMKSQSPMGPLSSNLSHL